MRRLLFTAFTAALILIFSYPVAQAENLLVQVPGFVTLEYPKQIKLSKKNCQYVPIAYEINQELNLDGAAFLIQIVHLKKKKQAGAVTWHGKIQGYSLLPMPLIGELKLKFCQKEWAIQESKFIAIKPGAYDIYIAYGTYQPDGLTSKQVITKKIKFYR